MTVIESIHIKAPTQDVFAYLMDVNNRKSYIPALEEVIMIDPLPIKLGSRYTEVARIAGRKLKTTYQVIDFELNERITAKTIKSIFPIEAGLLLKEDGDTCILTIELLFKLSGIFKLASGVVSGIVRQQARDILDQIKQNLE